MAHGETDYYRINRRLKRRRLMKNLSFLWVLLIVPMGFLCYFLGEHTGSGHQGSQAIMAAAGFPIPTRSGRAVPLVPPAPRGHYEIAPRPSAISHPVIAARSVRSRARPHVLHRHAKAKKVVSHRWKPDSPGSAVATAPALVRE